MILDNLKQKLGSAAAEAGCEEAIEFLMGHAGECVYFFNMEGKPSGSAIGASHIGGSPDLADLTVWPPSVDRGRGVAGDAIFIAQFNLAELPALDTCPLPKMGLLLLFLREWGSESVKLAGIYEPDTSVLKPRSRNLPTGLEDAPTAFRAMPIRFQRGVSLPVSDHRFQKAFDELAPGAAIEELIDAIQGEAKGQIGGHSWQAEHNTLRSVVFEQNGWSEFTKADEYLSLAAYEDELTRLQFPRLAELRPKVQWVDNHRAEINAEVMNWTLLCSFSQNMRAKLHFGSAVALDVYLRSADLRSMDLSRLIGQAPQ